MRPLGLAPFATRPRPAASLSCSPTTCAAPGCSHMPVRPGLHSHTDGTPRQQAEDQQSAAQARAPARPAALPHFAPRPCPPCGLPSIKAWQSDGWYKLNRLLQLRSTQLCSARPVKPPQPAAPVTGHWAAAAAADAATAGAGASRRPTGAQCRCCHSPRSWCIRWSSDRAAAGCQAACWRGAVCVPSSPPCFWHRRAQQGIAQVVQAAYVMVTGPADIAWPLVGPHWAPGWRRSQAQLQAWGLPCALLDRRRANCSCTRRPSTPPRSVPSAVAAMGAPAPAPATPAPR